MWVNPEIANPRMSRAIVALTNTRAISGYFAPRTTSIRTVTAEIRVAGCVLCLIRAKNSPPLNERPKLREMRARSGDIGR